MNKKKFVTLETFKKYHDNLIKYINKHDDLVLNGEAVEDGEFEEKNTKINSIFCKHENSDVVCWHWTHGWTNNDFSFIEIQLKCKDCDKYYFVEIRDRDECDKFVLEHKDKQWSDTCKPVL